eukprot:TRINITY_DN4030_c0_g1_i1.p1 TRINITY_DN4030_c0_g1~~TRINITY_DN4030_c0_g1_i1.p1  ORF type:complete len:344 (-),score=48.94 TRINITY_DN4030_c0_g1_i1:41-1072(-)
MEYVYVDHLIYDDEYSLYSIPPKKEYMYYTGQYIDCYYFKDFVRRTIWMSYRTGFPKILGEKNKIKSDTGWGCMIRAGQMMLAEAYRFHFMPKRIVDDILFPEDAYFGILVEIVNWFHDTPDCPYSIHSIVYLGESMGTPAGNWFGPSLICNCLRNLSKETDLPLNIYTTDNTTIYMDEIENLMDKGDGDWTHSLCVFIPLRLGVKKLNPLYYNSILTYMKFKESIGMIGGSPGSAYYFVGFKGKKLYYLDPHTTQKFKTKSSDDLYQSYFPNTPKSMHISELDHSIAFGFYFTDENSFSNFIRKFEKIKDKGMETLFSIEEHREEHEYLLSNNSGDDFSMDI